VQTFCRGLLITLLLAIAGAMPVNAQSGGGVRCTDQAQQALRQIGGWAENQCESTLSLAFAPVTFGRCSDQAVEGLRRVGGWAEDECVLPGSEIGVMAH
jgi:hypothetical protein